MPKIFYTLVNWEANLERAGHGIGMVSACLARAPTATSPRLEFALPG